MPNFLPGDLVREYARRMGWPLGHCNVMVEGALDRDFLVLASNLHYSKFGRRLIGDDLEFFPPGDGDAGGTFGILEHFPALRQIASTDLDHNGRLIYRFVTLLDRDSAGISASRALTAKYRQYQLFKDVFILARSLPCSSRDRNTLQRSISNANAPWNGLDCEIEDLIPLEMLQLFVDEQTAALRRDPDISNNGHHFEWEPSAKRHLYRFVERNAEYEDLHMLTNTIKFFRFYFNLPQEGV